MKILFNKSGSNVFNPRWSWTGNIDLYTFGTAETLNVDPCNIHVRLQNGTRWSFSKCGISPPSWKLKMAATAYIRTDSNAAESIASERNWSLYYVALQEQMVRWNQCGMVGCSAVRIVRCIQCGARGAVHPVWCRRCSAPSLVQEALCTNWCVSGAVHHRCSKRKK